MMLKLIFEKPKIPIADEVARRFRKDGRRKKDAPQPWTNKERLLIVALLALTILLSIFFWWQGNGSFPAFDFGAFSLGETITIEK